MHSVSCTNIHHDVTVLLNHQMVKKLKTWTSWEWNTLFPRNKKILDLCLKWHILRSYCFVAEVTFNDIKDLNMTSLRTLVCVLCNKVSSLLRSDTCGFLLVLWFNITHTTHSRASRVTHSYKYIFTRTVMYSQQLPLLHWMNNSLMSKIYFPESLFCSKTIHLQKSYLLIRCY